MRKSRTAKMERDQTLRALGSPDLREVTGAGRIRIPIGYTETGEPIYAEDDGSGGSDEDGF